MNIEQFCRHFKLLRENCDLEIEFHLKHCYVHKRGKTIIYLSFDDGKNIDIKALEDKLKEYLDSLLIQNSGWFFSSSRQCLNERSYFKFKNIVEFNL